MDTLLVGNGITNKRLSTNDFLSKASHSHAKFDSRQSANSPSSFGSIVDKMYGESHRLSLQSAMLSNQHLPMSLRQMPYDAMDEMRQLRQQAQREKFLESTINSMHSSELSKPDDPNESKMFTSFQKQNLMLLDCMKRSETKIKELEVKQSKLTQDNVRLKSELREQLEINKNLVQRNTTIVLDTSAKDQQIAVLKEQRKCLSKQNTKLKNFLQKADAHLESLQSQQYILQQRQKLIQQSTASVESEGRDYNATNKKRKRDDAAEWDSAQAIKGEIAGSSMHGDDAVYSHDVISIEEDDSVAILETHVLEDSEEDPVLLVTNFE